MGPEGFRAYEYVDDGAFAEPWLGLRPWTSVRIWEVGLHTCLWNKALREEKEKSEGPRATRMVLWGLTLCTVDETVSLPEDKLKAAQAFLSQSCFDPGVTRIPLGTLQSLRGKAEHWSLRNEALGPELHVIGKLLRPYQGLPTPHGVESVLKQTYFDFWETMESFRVNMSDTHWWSSTYRSSFYSILSLPERLSFVHEARGLLRIGSDATLNRCAAVDHTHKPFTVFEVGGYQDYLSNLTGLPRGDYELIAITEFLSLVCFLIAQSDNLRVALSVTWGITRMLPNGLDLKGLVIGWRNTLFAF